MHLSGYSPYSKYSEFLVCSVLHATYYEREFPKTNQYFFLTIFLVNILHRKGVVCVWNNCADYFLICLLVQDFYTPGVRFVKCHVVQVLEYSQLVRLDFPGGIFHLRSCKPIL